MFKDVRVTGLSCMEIVERQRNPVHRPVSDQLKSRVDGNSTVGLDPREDLRLDPFLGEGSSQSYNRPP